MNRVLASMREQRRLRFFGLSVALSLLLGGAVIAAAQTTVSPVTVPPDPETVSSQSERIIQRETAYKAQLPSIANAKVISKCSAAHQVISNVASLDGISYSTRLATYDQLANQLADDITKLKAQGITNADLNSAATNYYKAVDAYLTDHSNFKAAMDDLTAIDCTKDPTGFAASLLDARKLRQQMATDSLNIKANIKPVQLAVASIKQQLGKGN